MKTTSVSSTPVDRIFMTPPRLVDVFDWEQPPRTLNRLNDMQIACQSALNKLYNE